MRLWRADGQNLRIAAGPDPGWPLGVPPRSGLVTTPEGVVWLEPVNGAHGIWLELGASHDAEEHLPRAAPQVVSVVAALLESERQRAYVAEELAGRYEEIELLYAISEILGRTLRLDEAAQIIVREVSTVVGARRASIMVFDEPSGTLRTVAARGFAPDNLLPVPVEDDCSIAARVFRDRRTVTYDPSDPASLPSECGGDRGYRGHSFLSVPITYAAPGAEVRCVGVMNLTDRIGGDRFTLDDRKLVSAVANQIGAAIENARLVERDSQQQRLQRELELAHDLQLKLLPSPAVLQGDAEVAARCLPADSVGGDFYTFSRLGGGRVGVMLGDVSSHGFSAALVMALVMAAAGIHAAASSTPDETLRALLQSLSSELARTEMHFSVFYGVLDPSKRQLEYASAGHHHSFQVPRHGPPERLETTAPPLGLATPASIQQRQIPWSVGNDLLVLWTDGLVDARNELGEPFGEQRLLDEIVTHRRETPEAIVRQVLEKADEFGARPTDDRTLLVLRI
ncbi:MAG TPA: GAF domain-containing SpoIIE family protein phosphatase [Gemmatimonadales bacterium]|nr:GAF domain-containing SpoIIE family protein phosphatase [Gemmatimonadales bacterium]